MYFPKFLIRYARGTITSAINIPVDTLLSSENPPTQESEVYKVIKQYHGKIIAVMGSRSNHEQAVKVFLVD